MKILLFVHHFPPDVNSTGLLMSQLFTSLADAGHDVSVITTFPHYEGFRTWKRYRRKLFQRDRYGRLRVTRVYSFTSGYKGMLHRLLNYLTFNIVATVVALVSRPRLDLVFCTNGSFFSGVSGRLIGWWHRAPVVLNIQDLYPDVAISQGLLSNRFAIGALRIVERWMYQHADHLSVITDSFRRRIMARGVPSTSISVVPNFVDVDFIRPLPRQNPFSAQNGLDGRFVVTHAGNVGQVYDLARMIEVAATLHDRKDILILIVGEGVAKASLERLRETMSVENVRFMPFVPTRDLPWLRASSDVQLSLYKSSAADYSMPSKLYEIMASGRPVLASAERGTDVHQIVEQTGCGICVDPGDHNALALALLQLRGDPQLRTAMGERGRAAVLGGYSLSSVATRYEEIFKKLLGARSMPETGKG